MFIKSLQFSCRHFFYFCHIFVFNSPYWEWHCYH
jgi:hypothetical protein